MLPRGCLMLLQRGGPGLIRHETISRIDDPARTPDWRSAESLCEIVSAGHRIGEREGAGENRAPDALYIRLPVGQARWLPRRADRRLNAGRLLFLREQGSRQHYDGDDLETPSKTQLCTPLQLSRTYVLTIRTIRSVINGSSRLGGAWRMYKAPLALSENT